MDTAQFLSLCRQQGYSEQNEQRFQAALTLAHQELTSKLRLNNESCFEHNLRVGLLLVENKADPETIIAGLLHSLFYLKEKIRLQFGEEVWLLVLGGEEIKTIKSKNKQLEAEALRKIFLATLKDIRIILVKLATKIDNVRTIEALPPAEQKRIAREALEVYAPLASRLGAERMRVELEDLAFKVLQPQKYREIANFFAESREERERAVTEAIHLIQKLCHHTVSLLNIKGRPKHFYSIYKKMTQRGVNLRQQYDLLGLRIIVADEKDCYLVLGLLHENFMPVEGRLKDYIANPKPNLYRSIHTGVRLANGKVLEVQIRTPEMDEFAEEGIAAHWRYKGIKSEELFEKKVAWLREVLKLQKELESSEFLEAAKIDLFGDEIYCYTPKGEVKELPLGATILDFAYSVHEQVGNQAVGGKVNGKFVALDHALAAGDVVEIMTNKNQRPRRSWLKIVKSAKSRQKIRKTLKEHEKLAPLHYRQLKIVSAEEQGVLVEALETPTALCTLAQCCSPLPGEAIAGIPTKRRVISVHRQDCRAVEKEQERVQNVRWKNTFNQKIRFTLTAEERSGLLADALHTIAQAGFEVQEAKAKLLGSGIATCSFLIIPKDLKYLQELVYRVKKLRGIKRIDFE